MKGDSFLVILYTMLFGVSVFIGLAAQYNVDALTLELKQCKDKNANSFAVK